MLALVVALALIADDPPAPPPPTGDTPPSTAPAPAPSTTSKVDGPPRTDIADLPPPAPLLDETVDVRPDPKKAAPPPKAHVTIRVKAVNGVDVDTRLPVRVWPLDDVVLAADADDDSDDSDDSDDGLDDADYRWSILERPSGSNVELADADSDETGFYFDVRSRRLSGLDLAGDYRVRLTLSSDAKGLIGTKDYALHVGWPKGTSPLDEHGAREPTTLARKGKTGHTDPTAPDPRHEMVLGSMTGCAVGMLVPCALGFCGAATGGGGVGAFELATAACGPCSTCAAVAGAGVGAHSASLDFLDVSPWLLTGVGVEVAGLSILAATLVYSGATANFGIPGPVVSPDGNLIGIGAITGVLLALVGGPATIVAAYATAPTEAPPPHAVEPRR